MKKIIWSLVAMLALMMGGVIAWACYKDWLALSLFILGITPAGVFTTALDEHRAKIARAHAISQARRDLEAKALRNLRTMECSMEWWEIEKLLSPHDKALYEKAKHTSWEYIDDIEAEAETELGKELIHQELLDKYHREND